MFFIFILCLVPLSDPLPTTTISSISVDNDKSRISPIVPKSTTLHPTRLRLSKHSSNETSHTFYEMSNSSIELLSKMNADYNKSFTDLSAPISPLSPSSKLKEHRNIAKFIRGETEVNVVASETGRDGSKIKHSNALVTALSMDLKRKDQTDLSPPVLKLDKEYNPREIAEYVFSTGDEKGFAQGIMEMIEDGEIMVSRDDVIVFLEAVQQELVKLRSFRDDYDAKVGGSEKESV